MIPKNKRWENKRYTRWVATHECAACGMHDDTISPHHLRHIYAQLSGATSYKASDWLTMPLCYSCHDKAHTGEKSVVDWQAQLIFMTLDKAFRDGIIHG